MKVQPPAPRKAGLFAQDAFAIDTRAETVRCPNDVVVQIHRLADGSGVAEFKENCSTCTLRPSCTDSISGRTIKVHPKNGTLTKARARQRDPGWKARYRAIRPKVERKLASLVRRKHGGRRARVRGRARIAQDFSLLAAAINLCRLAVLGIAGHALASS